MGEKIIVSSYPLSVVIGNYRWRPGINIVKEEDWAKIHWPSIDNDKSLTELKERLPEKETQNAG